MYTTLIHCLIGNEIIKCSCRTIHLRQKLTKITQKQNSTLVPSLFTSLIMKVWAQRCWYTDSPKKRAHSFPEKNVWACVFSWLSCRDNYKPPKQSCYTAAISTDSQLCHCTHTEKWSGPVVRQSKLAFLSCVCHRQLELPMRLFLSRGHSVLDGADDVWCVSSLFILRATKQSSTDWEYPPDNCPPDP